MKVQICGICEQDKIEGCLRTFPGQKITMYTCSECTKSGKRYCADCEEVKDPEEFPEIVIGGVTYKRKLCKVCFEVKEAKKAERKAKKAAKEAKKAETL